MAGPVTIRFRWLAGADPALGLPTYATEGAAGADLRANFPPGERGGLDLGPSGRALIPTGLSLEIPEGYEAQIRPRSGLALRSGLTLLNSPGTIDSDYRGPLGVILYNASDTSFRVVHGARIAQIVVAPVERARFVEAEDLDPTPRGDGGFGSTGTS